MKLPGLSSLFSRDESGPGSERRSHFLALAEKALQHEYDELHRRVIVVQQKNFIEARLLGLGPRLRNNARAPFVTVATVAATIAARRLLGCPGRHRLGHGNGFFTWCHSWSIVALRG